MIGEPVMGVAGALVPPDGYWPRVREVLERHGILLIADEVVTALRATRDVVRQRPLRACGRTSS